jgi:hypothetical protein
MYLYASSDANFVATNLHEIIEALMPTRHLSLPTGNVESDRP